MKTDPDLVILDDPISSFDGNKKFAIINVLFMGKKCLKDRTVLLLTHEFNTVIDSIKNMSHLFNPAPKAAFLSTNNGVLSEKDISKNDIKSFVDISESNYEKMQLYRIAFNDNHDNDVIRKFINETFHIENDYLFQLDPREYNTIPQYIIDECDKEML